MFKKLTIDFKRKCWFYSINIFVTAILCFVIVFTPCYTELILLSNDDLIAFMAAEISIMVVIPVLFAGLLWLVANWRTPFKIFNKDDALRQVEQQLSFGTISLEKYREYSLFIEKFDLEKKKMRAEVEIEKMRVAENIKNQAKIEVEKMMEKAKGKGV